MRKRFKESESKGNGPMTPEQREESEALEKLGTMLSRYTVLLFMDRPGGRPQSFGTGLLVSAIAGSFLITAAHVIREIRKGRDVYFYIEPRTKLHLSFHPYLITNPPEGKDEDQDILDIGVLQFIGPRLPPYPAVDKWPLDVDYLLPNAMPREGKTYLIQGFPGSQGRVNPKNRNIKSKVYGYRNISHPTEQYKKLGVTPESHIAIIFERKRGIGPDGQTRVFPDPRGMSGSPVWLLYDGQEEPSDQKQLRVVGIANKHLKDQRTILATDISLAFALIYELQRRLEAAALLIGYRTMTPEDRAEEIRKKYRPESHTLDELQKMIEDEITAAMTEVEESRGKIANTAIA
ncbi:MAG: hypothetical protein ACREA2_19825 [Blastocatellia bacterium]